MRSNFSNTPNFPAAPHSTPSSVSFDPFRSKVPKAPIHNPFDKFPKPEFDAWIGDITGALRKALRHEDEEPEPKTHQSSPYVEHLLQLNREAERDSDSGHSGDEQVDDSFAELRARRVKGKARDPREGPGLGAGTLHEPIELDSEAEEEDDDDVDEHELEDDDRVEGEEGDELEQNGFFEEEGSEEGYEEEEEEAVAGRRLGHRRAQPALPHKERQFSVDEEYEGEEYEEEDDEGQEYEGEDRENDYYEGDEDDEGREYEEVGRENGRGDGGGEDVFEVLSDEDEAEGAHVVPKSDNMEIKYVEEDEEIEEAEEERMEAATETNIGDSQVHESVEGFLTPEGDGAHEVDDIEDVQPYTYEDGASRFATLTDTITPDLQSASTSTSASPFTFQVSNDYAPSPQPVLIPDPWAGPQTYAEDFYAGGDIAADSGFPVSADVLSELDRPSDSASLLTESHLVDSVAAAESAFQELSSSTLMPMVTRAASPDVPQGDGAEAGSSPLPASSPPAMSPEAEERRLDSGSGAVYVLSDEEVAEGQTGEDEEDEEYGMDQGSSPLPVDEHGTAATEDEQVDLDEIEEEEQEEEQEEEDVDETILPLGTSDLEIVDADEHQLDELEDDSKEPEIIDGSHSESGPNEAFNDFDEDVSPAAVALSETHDFAEPEHQEEDDLFDGVSPSVVVSVEQIVQEPEEVADEINGDVDAENPPLSQLPQTHGHYTEYSVIEVLSDDEQPIADEDGDFDVDVESVYDVTTTSAPAEYDFDIEEVLTEGRLTMEPADREASVFSVDLANLGSGAPVEETTRSTQADEREDNATIDNPSEFFDQETLAKESTDSTQAEQGEDDATIDTSIDLFTAEAPLPNSAPLAVDPLEKQLAETSALLDSENAAIAGPSATLAETSMSVDSENVAAVVKDVPSATSAEMAAPLDPEIAAPTVDDVPSDTEAAPALPLLGPSEAMDVSTESSVPEVVDGEPGGSDLPTTNTEPLQEATAFLESVLSQFADSEQSLATTETIPELQTITVSEGAISDESVQPRASLVEENPLSTFGTVAMRKMSIPLESDPYPAYLSTPALGGDGETEQDEMEQDEDERNSSNSSLEQGKLLGISADPSSVEQPAPVTPLEGDVPDLDLDLELEYPDPEPEPQPQSELTVAPVDSETEAEAIDADDSDAEGDIDPDFFVDAAGVVTPATSNKDDPLDELDDEKLVEQPVVSPVDPDVSANAAGVASFATLTKDGHLDDIDNGALVEHPVVSPVDPSVDAAGVLTPANSNKDDHLDDLDSGKLAEQSLVPPIVVEAEELNTPFPDAERQTAISPVFSVAADAEKRETSSAGAESHTTPLTLPTLAADDESRSKPADDAESQSSVPIAPVLDTEHEVDSSPLSSPISFKDGSKQTTESVLKPTQISVFDAGVDETLPRATEDKGSESNLSNVPQEAASTTPPAAIQDIEKRDIAEQTPVFDEPPAVASQSSSVPIAPPTKDVASDSTAAKKATEAQGNGTRRSKRKRKTPVTLQTNNAALDQITVARPHIVLRIPSAKSTKEGKKKEALPDSSDSASVSSASAAAKLLTGSRASSVVSDGSAFTQLSPTPLPANSASAKSRIPPPPPPPPLPQLMFHNHSRPKPVRPALSLQTQIHKTVARAPSFAQTNSSPVAGPSTESSPPTPTQAPHVLRRQSSSHSPVTRSHCRYHKISLPEEDNGPHIFFLVPGCSLVDQKLMREEEIVDHGDATYEDSTRKIADIETLGIQEYVLNSIRMLVGPDKEHEVFFMPRPGEERARRVVHRKSNLSRSSISAVSGAGSPRASNGNVLSPTSSSRTPLSAAGSSSTNRSYRPRLKNHQADAEGSWSAASSTDTDSGGDSSDEDHERARTSKRPKLAESAPIQTQQDTQPDQNQTQEQENAVQGEPSPSQTSVDQPLQGPQSEKQATVSAGKRGKRHGLPSDAAEYKPGADDVSSEDFSDKESLRPKKAPKKQRSLKRARTSEAAMPSGTGEEPERKRKKKTVKMVPFGMP